MTKKTKSRRSFNEEFKTQIVQLYLNGKRKCEIIREYDLSPSILNNWIKQFDNTGSFKTEYNIDPLEKELRALKKRNKQLEMENDILKQAALILGQK
jgi:transposase